MLEFIYNNIQWIFSGIGVTILSLIVHHFVHKNRSNGSGVVINKSKNIKIKNNKNQNVNIDNSKNIDIEGNINDK